jgi:hypothetical protein
MQEMLTILINLIAISLLAIGFYMEVFVAVRLLSISSKVRQGVLSKPEEDKKTKELAVHLLVGMALIVFGGVFGSITVEVSFFQASLSTLFFLFFGSPSAFYLLFIYRTKWS